MKSKIYIVSKALNVELWLLVLRVLQANMRLISDQDLYFFVRNLSESIKVAIPNNLTPGLGTPLQ